MADYHRQLYTIYQFLSIEGNSSATPSLLISLENFVSLTIYCCAIHPTTFLWWQLGDNFLIAP